VDFSFAALLLTKRPLALVPRPNDAAIAVPCQVFVRVVNRNDFAGAIAEGVCVHAGDYAPLSVSQEIIAIGTARRNLAQMNVWIRIPLGAGGGGPVTNQYRGD